MNRIALFSACALAILPAAAMADDQHMILQPEAIQWQPAPPAFPKGAQMAVLAGDPAKAEPYAVRIKVPAGYKVPAHMHPGDENVTVLSGAVHLGMGDKLDEKSGQAVKAGGFLHMPKGMNHYAWFTEDSVFQLNGVGPFGIDYVNPADDPRKAN